jgi:hypothetical protein
MGKLLKSDGSEQELQPRNGKKFVFQNELYRILKTDMIQVIQLADRSLMLVDEDAKVRPGERKPLNQKATALLMLAGGIPGDMVLGDVVICARKEFLK